MLVYINFIVLILSQLVVARKFGYSALKIDHNFVDQQVTSASFRIRPSLMTWDAIDTPKKFSLTSMVVDHHSDGSWYVQSLHEKYSIGWNRTTRNQFLTRPYACNIRFIGVGLEDTMQNFVNGGTGYLALSYTKDKKPVYHGFDKNETNRLHCYYSTNKNTGSNFLDKPRTVGVAVYCPVILDDESGGWFFKSIMKPGDYCRVLADHNTDVEIHLRPSDFTEDSPIDEGKEIMAEVQSVAAGSRQRQIRELMVLDHRPHAVCTVQTFRNRQSGSMLYLFVSYYQLLGWRVIVYDRFGLHEEFLKELIGLPGVDYYPYTMYQLTQPSKYNHEYKIKMSNERKTFYRDELRRGKYNSTGLADTADQDADKTRTYDHARMEYSHLDTILYIDADELFYCPQQPNSTEAQGKFQLSLMTDFQLKGIEEMRFVRIPYSGLAPADFTGVRAQVDFTPQIEQCMHAGFMQRSLLKMLQCWSGASSFDKFQKSADLAGVCPFHYNHWSCDGMRGGGRDMVAAKTCRCKVALDMQNWFNFRPMLDRCHLVHLHDNKYRYESKLDKAVHDKGDIRQYSPLVKLFESPIPH